MNKDTRIKLNDTMLDVFHKMSEGNPGALTAMMEIHQSAEKIDPDAFMGPLSPILSLDTLGIYGSDIYVLWSDICHRNTAKMITVLRGWQLGYINGDKVADAAHRQDYSGSDMIDIEDLYKKVKERLPNFDPENKAGITIKTDMEELKEFIKTPRSI
jgi:hypothetical protein